MIYITETFPIDVNRLPKLFCYNAEVSGTHNEIHQAIGSISYYLRREFGGHWVKSGMKIVSDNLKSNGDIERFLQMMWQEGNFSKINSIKLNENLQSSNKEIADFVAKGLFSDVEKEVEDTFKQYNREYNDVRIVRYFEVKGYIVNNIPSISISIYSNIFSKIPLKNFLSKLSDEERTKIGELEIYVKSKFSNHKGRIIKIVGTLSEHRKRLLRLSSDKRMQQAIEKAGDDEIVVSMFDERNKRSYDYIESALVLIIEAHYAHKLDINEDEWNNLFNSLKIKPSERVSILKNISKIVKNRLPIMDAFNSKKYPKLFITSKDIGFKATIRTKNAVFDWESKEIIKNISGYGLYKRNEKFDTNPLKIAIIDAIKINKENYLDEMLKLLKSLNFNYKVLEDFKLKEDDIYNYPKLEKIVSSIEEPDIFLAFLPNQIETMDSDDENNFYYNFKRITLARQIASQIVLEKTIDNKYAIYNIVLGIIGKTGNIPFILEKPIEVADYVVGIDVSREKKKNLPGSQNISAVVRIYFNNGAFFEYYIKQFPIEGESLPLEVIREIFPPSIFQNKRVVIHRDGRFTSSEKTAFKNWASEISAKFYLVEIIKSGSPRIYTLDKRDIKSPEIGTTFLLDNNEAFIITSSSSIGTPRPLHIRIDVTDDFNIIDALYSILSMRLLHYGSLILPRLPVTIHYGDRIANMALRKVIPKNLIGNNLYWL